MSTILGQLPHDQLQEQLDTIDCLLAMYPGDGEVSIDAKSRSLLEKLRACLECNDMPVFTHDTSEIILRLMISIPSKQHLQLSLSICFALYRHDPALSKEPPLVRFVVERTTWLPRRDYDTMLAGMPSDAAHNLPDTIDYLQTTVSDMLTSTTAGNTEVCQSEDSLTRVWFYFPSLSTREKRNDLVTLAPSYGLTGFVLAGKPGVLCLEGTSDNIQAYIADIKRNSWGDIPSFQKKITERIREEDDIVRKFDDMREITDEIDRHGQRGNRGDLSQVEKFLEQVGLAHVFAPIFMQKT